MTPANIELAARAKRVADLLTLHGELPAGVHVGVDLGEPLELSIHGCRVSGLAALIEANPDGAVQRDSYGNPHNLTVDTGDVEWTYFL